MRPCLTTACPWRPFNSELTAMTVAATTATPPSEIYSMVSGASQQASASSTLGAAGASLDRIAFLVVGSNSVRPYSMS